jgi:hypothetical protein
MLLLSQLPELDGVIHRASLAKPVVRPDVAFSGELADVANPNAKDLGGLSRAYEFPLCLRCRVHGQEFSGLSSGCPFFLCHASSSRNTLNHTDQLALPAVLETLYSRFAAIFLTDGVRLYTVYSENL